MSLGARERPSPRIDFGRPADDPLVARLLPDLPADSAGQVNWGLERVGRMLATLDDPHSAYPVLHVAGTNGKGSVARIWAEVLQAAGFRTGLYTSPHLISFRERILVDRRPIPDELFEEWSIELRPSVAREAPSFFEATTALAFLAFCRAEVDVAVVEVGMGGRLDATNVVSPVLTAITNVALDHAEMLGATPSEIAKEKAGIMKRGVPCFTATNNPDVFAALSDEAMQRGALLEHVSQPNGQMGIDGVSLSLDTGRWGDLDLDSPLVGHHQLANIALAVRALEALPSGLQVSTTAVEVGVRSTRVPGRFQVEGESDRLWIMDIAHNLDGAKALAETIERLELRRPRIGVVGVLADKPWLEMLQELDRVLDTVILTVASSAPKSRALRPEVAAQALAPDRLSICPDVESAMEAARTRVGHSGVVVVTGSCHTVGEGLIYLQKIPQEALPVPFDSG